MCRGCLAFQKKKKQIFVWSNPPFPSSVEISRDVTVYRCVLCEYITRYRTNFPTCWSCNTICWMFVESSDKLFWGFCICTVKILGAIQSFVKWWLQKEWLDYCDGIFIDREIRIRSINLAKIGEINLIILAFWNQSILA